MSVFNIPSDQPFLRCLAQGVLEMAGDTQLLSSVRILLPNRRACESLRDTFLDLTGGRPLLLPQIRPLGDIDEEELSFSFSSEIAARMLDIPPAMPPLKRRFLLAQLIRQLQQKTGSGHGNMSQFLEMATALGRLMDQIIIEEVSFDRLENLAPEEFADHWQITLDFLKILRETWPRILQSYGMIEAAERRNRLLHLLTQEWQERPPQTPILAAGSTGTFPATARLLNVIKDLPQGQVILPGLDQFLDTQSWQALDASHPQYTLKELLEQFGLARESVKNWRGDQHKTPSQRMRICSEMMRPAETAEQWRELALNDAARYDWQNALTQVTRYDCKSAAQEAHVIALKLRQILEDPEKTAAVVTPDRELASSVQMVMRRWGVAIDDTAGAPLRDQPTGVFIRLALQAASPTAGPAAILALMQNPLCCLGLDWQNKNRELQDLDAKHLRGPTPAQLSQKLKETHIGARFIELCGQFPALTKVSTSNLEQRVQEHIQFLESLARTPTESGAERLWKGEEGEAAAQFFSELLQHLKDFQEIGLEDYHLTIDLLMKDKIIRPRYGMHPRIHIMGQIEARLQQYDVMILGGLNEGSWPPDPGVDPWMSRVMKMNFGLPDPERTIGQAAHDFVQAFSAPEVVITRAQRQEGAPTVPARWLQRLDTVLKAAALEPGLLRQGPFTSWVEQLDAPGDEIIPVKRPQPAPPLATRPRELPVTAIESWMRDPYALYARYILNLRPLDPVEQEADAALRGSWLHDLLKWFVGEFPDQLPPQALECLLHHARHDENAPIGIEIWMPRLYRLAQWFVDQEVEWRAQARPWLTETKGVAEIEDFCLTAKADRIDRLTAQGVAIIDYKTGRVPTLKEVQSGISPQLPLEALIFEKGGFDDYPDQVNDLAYWQLTGGRDPGKAQHFKAAKNVDLPELVREAEAGLKNLIACFSDEQVPYLSLPDPAIAPPEEWQDYAQLARVAEWTAFEDMEGT